MNTRESPALDILELPVKRGAVVSHTDPYVPRVPHAGQCLASVPFDRGLLEGYDGLSTNHTAFDYERMTARL